MNYTNKTDWTFVEAIDRFNADMSNSCDDGDRKLATTLLAKRLGDTERAAQLRREWSKPHCAVRRVTGPLPEVA